MKKKNFVQIEEGLRLRKKEWAPYRRAMEQAAVRAAAL